MGKITIVVGQDMVVEQDMVVRQDMADARVVRQIVPFIRPRRGLRSQITLGEEIL